MVSVELEDVNEFSPEFEHQNYQVVWEFDPLEFNKKLKRPSEVGNDGPMVGGQMKAKETTEVKASDRASGSEADEWRQLAIVRAHDQDCNKEFQGRVCSYELQASDQLKHQNGPALFVDLDGKLRAKRSWLEQLSGASGPLAPSQQPNPQSNGDTLGQFNFQVLAYDCGGKKSQRPANVQLKVMRKCHASWKGE